MKKYGPPGYRVTKERMEEKIYKEWQFVPGWAKSPFIELAKESVAECEAHNAQIRARMSGEV